MKYYKQILLVSFVILIGFGLFLYLDNKKQKTVVKTEDNSPSVEQKVQENKVEKNISKEISKPKQEVIEAPKEVVKKADLYNNFSSNMINFSTISQSANSSSKIQREISNIINSSQAIFYSAKTKDKLYLIKEISSEYSAKHPRHGLEFIEISLNNGEIEKFSPSYSEDNESETDIWEYDKETGVPISHVHKDNDGNVIFTELWNQKKDVKYKMLNSKDEIISMFKETVEDGTQLRQEHIFYDTEGNIRMNISANYDGQDLVRFTYFDVQNPEYSGSIISEYQDGVKQKETVYTSDYKVKNIYEAKYEDGERVELKEFDADNNEIDKILSK